MGGGDNGQVEAARIQAEATRYAARIQADTADKQMALQKEIYDIQQKFLQDQEDYNRARLQENRDQYSKLMSDAGQQAIDEIKNAAVDENSWLNKKFTGDDLQNDAGYQFRLQQGQNALNNSLAATSGLLSGAALKATDKYNQGFASNEFQNAYNRDLTDKNTRLAGLNNAANLQITGINGWTGQNQGTSIGTQLTNLAGGYNSGMQNLLGNKGDNEANLQLALGKINANAALQQNSGGLSGILGGAVGGAATGFSIGGPWGAAAGGILGALGSSNLF